MSSQEIPYLSLSNSEFKEYEEFYEEYEWKIYTKRQEVFLAGFLPTGKLEDRTNPVPMYLQIHDEEQTLDLKQEKWISSKKI